MGCRAVVVEVPAGALVKILRGAGRLPADAVAVGPPSVDGGVVLQLVRSAEFAEAKDGEKFPRVPVR